MGETYSSYKPIEVAVVTATTNDPYCVATAYSGSTKLLHRAHFMSIVTDQTITIKFDTTSGDPITVKAADGIVRFENLNIRNVFITNASGSTANIRMVFIGVEKQ
jgi:hypothetical protein